MENTNSNYVDFPPIAEIYGDKGFLKVKPNMIDKGKMFICQYVTDVINPSCV